MSAKEVFRYGHHCDFEAFIQIKIGTLEGKRKKPTHKEILENPILKYAGRNQDCSDLYVECIVHNGGPDGDSLSVTTSYKAFTTRWNWNEWLELPLQFRSLSKNAMLLITIYDYDGPGIVVPVGGTSISFFEQSGLFRQGLVDLRVWPDVKAHITDTPGIDPLSDDKNDQMHRLNKLVKKHEAGQMDHIDWLDRLTFREIEVINDKEKRTSKFMYLMIEFPKIFLPPNGERIDLIFWDRGLEEYLKAEKQERHPLDDPEIGLENLVERKHHFLTRSLRSGITDKDQKPNSAIRDTLFKVMEYTPTKQLTSEEQDLVWKYRFYLSSHKKALPKFLKCVNWELKGESDQAIDMLKRWAPLDPHEALELLSPAFTCPDVRFYAVERLSYSSDEDLLLYLLQLVQALRYESYDLDAMNLLDVSHYSLGSDSSSADNGALHTNEPILSKESKIISNKECELESSYSSKDSEEHTLHVSTENAAESLQEQSSLLLEKPNDSSEPGLASFLIQRACQNPTLANYLYWYLSVECEEKIIEQEQNLKPESKAKEIYLFVFRSFKIALQQGNSRQTWQNITRQNHFVNNLVSILNTVTKESGGRPKKNEKLQSLLADPEATGGFCMTHFDPLPLPLDPETNVIGLIPEKAHLFKSALEPCRLTFKTAKGTEYVAIFKSGDDLRQDQLIIGIIMLIDTLLQNENLDLKLTPYKVIATGQKSGFMEFVDSVPVAEAIRCDGGICGYLRRIGPCESAPLGISKEVMDNYIKSLAGYSVITYLLGIGDRHFDNLLLTKEGSLFHIDFGYILGRDPKPLPPPIKFTKEMVEGMGGLMSPQYKEFRKLCYTAFHQLRRHSNLILNLFSLMVESSVPDIMLEPDKLVKKVEDRLCLSLSDEEAASHMQDVIDASLNALVPVMVEKIHLITQYMRK